jgi:hypothetical protein
MMTEFSQVILPRSVLPTGISSFIDAIKFEDASVRRTVYIVDSEGKHSPSNKPKGLKLS